PAAAAPPATTPARTRPQNRSGSHCTSSRSTRQTDERQEGSCSSGSCAHAASTGCSAYKESEIGGHSPASLKIKTGCGCRKETGKARPQSRRQASGKEG